ncbi:MAG: type II toxin-antitoxin system VapC family toxin [Dehalococcoidia bacterium]|nr:type II toxin-antitoxin system VapC family toxin [Dehalococcoidia bacterium]
MTGYLLDSDAVIDYLRGIERSRALIQELYDRGERLCTCSVVIAEVYAGMKPDHMEVAEELLLGLTFLPTSLEAARQAGQWRYAYDRRGISLSTADVLIAATARLHQAAVITGNGSHYPMPEVRVLPLPR